MNDPDDRGKFRVVRHFVVTCATCDNDAYYWGPRNSWAQLDFNAKGWRKRKGVWLCPKCAEIKKGEK